MMMFTRRQLLTAAALLTLLASASAVQGQFRPSQKYWTVGGTLGVSGYAGDLTSPNNSGIPLTQVETLKNPGFEIGFQAAYHFAPRWAVRGSLNYLLLRGTDEGSRNSVRNLSFENGIIEGSAVLMFDVLPARRNYRLRRTFTPYIFGGIAVTYSDPRARIVVTAANGVSQGFTYNIPGPGGVPTPVTFAGVPTGDYGWQRLRPLQTEGVSYSPVFVSVPFGAGVRWRATERINVGLELNVRLTFTDYLDDVSGATPLLTVAGDQRTEGFYPLPIQLNNDPLRIAASNRVVGVNAPSVYADRRGTSKFNDWYGSIGFNVAYILDKSPGGVRCPKPNRRGKKGFLGIF